MFIKLGAVRIAGTVRIPPEARDKCLQSVHEEGTK